MKPRPFPTLPKLYCGESEAQRMARYRETLRLKQRGLFFILLAVLLAVGRILWLAITAL